MVSGVDKETGEVRHQRLREDAFRRLRNLLIESKNEKMHGRIIAELEVTAGELTRISVYPKPEVI